MYALSRIAHSSRTSWEVREVPEGDIGDLVPYNRGRRLRRPHLLRRGRVGHPFYVIVRGDDRRRPNVVACFHYLDCFDTACRKDGPGARKVVSDLALDSSLCRAIGAAGTPDPWCCGASRTSKLGNSKNQSHVRC